MSLNGLDDPKVKEAHEAAAAEPGGWFLLKYASRDEVELLGRGNGGIVEVRNNIAQYEETSPLFGFLKYRRRNVLIKYLPDDCSRLIQARVTVHFNAVCERFAPYNATFSISTAKELKDTKLSAACSLHAASGSTSSSTSSLRRRRLMEIAEEEEEEQRAVKRSSTVLEDDDGGSDTDRPKSPDSPPPPVTLNAELAAQPEESKFSPSTDPPDFVGVDRPTSPAQSMDNGRRMSSQTARPDFYSYSSYPYGKPKVKLGPRPSLDVGGRPKTAAGAFRPVSQMPSGFKMYSKGSKRVKADNDNDLAEQTDPTEMAFPTVNNPLADHASLMAADDESLKSPTSPGRPATSSGVSMKSPVMHSFPSSVKNTMTPEKARLMRAMQLREKKKKASLQPPAAADEVPQDETSEEKGDTAEAPAALASLPEEEEKRLSMNKLAEVIAEPAAETLQTDHSESARSDSRPESPLEPSSEPDQSTKASSLSESTDETVKGTEPEKSEDEPSPAGGVVKMEPGSDSEPEKEEDQTLVARDSKDSRPEEREEAVVAAKTEHLEEAVPELKKEDGDNAGDPKPTEAAPAAEDPRPAEIKEEEVAEEAKEKPEDPVQQSPPQAERPEQLTLKSDMDEQDMDEPPLTPPISKFATNNTMSPNRMTPENRGTAILDDDMVSTPPHLTASPASPSVGIPTSKFSTTAPSPSATLPTIVPPPAPGKDDLDSRPTTGGDETQVSQEKIKRRTIEPIRTDVSVPPSEANLSDDEDLMDELQSATVQQAKPMFVSKSPISPVFPNSPAEVDGKGNPRVVRTISNPIRGNLLTPADVVQNSARSVSSGAAYLHKITQQQTSSRENLAPKTGKLGSRISQRIKALEMLSANAPGDAPSRSNSTRSNTPSAAFFSVGKGREPSRSPSVAERATSLTRRSPQRTNTAISDSHDGSPEPRVPRDRSGSMASRLSMFEPVPVIPPASTMPRGRPESISVTARILRDPSEAGASELPKDLSEFSRLDLKHSPLEVNHQRAADPSPSAASKATLQERRMSREIRRSMSRDRDDEEETKGRRSSLSIVRDFIKDRRKSLTSASTDILTPPSVLSPKSSPSRPPSTHNNSGSSFPRRLSISSRRSSISKDVAAGALSPSSATEASGSGDDSRSTKSDKKKSRAGRFMRRLSSSISSSLGKGMTPTLISPTVKEEDLADLSELHPAQPSVQYMGDVNVQFPDNLLWKRRTLGIDNQGFLILTVSATNAGNKDKPATGVKRYHLSEFRTPYTPDVEVQELPNSVVLDLIEGPGLQMACEDRAGQLELLHTLLEAHQSHTSFGQ